MRHRLTQPFSMKWIRDLDNDEFEELCAVFWDAHQKPMQEATIAVADGLGSDEHVKAAVRVGMRAAVEHLQRRHALINVNPVGGV